MSACLCSFNLMHGAGDADGMVPLTGTRRWVLHLGTGTVTQLHSAGDESCMLAYEPHWMLASQLLFK